MHNKDPWLSIVFLTIHYLFGFQKIRRSNVIDKMLCLGMKDKAVKMLLESTAATDPSDPTFYEYNLRACLVATCRSPGKQCTGKNSTPEVYSMWGGDGFLVFENLFALYISYKLVIQCRGRN